jgi:hypothetical protein
MISRAVAPVVFGLLLLAAWQAIVMMVGIPEYLLPAPTAIVATVDRALAVSFAVTFIEALAGFLIASALAFAVATLFVRFHTLEDGLFPIAIAIKTTPIVAIAPLLVIWLGTGWWSKIVAAILICFFPVLVNTVKGLKAADLEYRELFRRSAPATARSFASCGCLIVCLIYSRRSKSPLRLRSSAPSSASSSARRRGSAISSSSLRRIWRPRRCFRRSSPRRSPASPCSTPSISPSAG